MAEAAALPSFRSRLARNAGFIVAARAWSIVQWILVTPFVLHRLGPERFGVWSLLFLLSGYLATFDLGLGASVVKFTAQHAAARDWERLRATLGQITWLYLLLAVVWVLAIFLGSSWILAWLRIPPVYLGEVRFALLASAVIFAFANLVSVGVGVLNGMQRMDLASAITVGASIPQLALLLFGLSHGQGLYAVVASTALNWILVAVLTFVAARRLAPEAKWPSLHRGRGAGWFRYSTVMQLVNVVNLSQQQVDKLFLTSWIGLAAVTRFELGFRVANAVQSLPVLALAPLIPAFAEIDASGDRDRLRSLSRRATDLLFLAAALLAACAIPAAPLIVRGWVGGDYPEAEVLAQWMIAALSINLLTGVASSAVRGAGRPVMELGPGVVGLVVHLAASFFFVRRLGVTGAGPALAVAMTVSCVIFLVRFHRWLGEPSARWLLAPLARAAAAATPAVLAGLWVATRWPAALRSTRMGLLGGGLLAALVAAGAFLLVWWLVRLRGRDARSSA